VHCEPNLETVEANQLFRVAIIPPIYIRLVHELELSWFGVRNAVCSPVMRVGLHAD
jgi:hypothetical protein